jgi:hypothetical protein
MQPDPSELLEIARIETPPIGFYDAPDPEAFEPLVRPRPDSFACVFAFFNTWLKGKTLQLNEESFGCRGAGRYLCGVQTRSRDELVSFLVDEEGLKASRALMQEWLDHRRTYQRRHKSVFIGPLRPEQHEYLRSVTFYVTPDQLALMSLGAQYRCSPSDPQPVLAPFGAGCMQLVTLFEDLEIPQAVLGATDIAMRMYLPPSLLAFTVTVPLFEQLCSLDERSFLHKPFWRKLKKSRGM